MDTKGDVLIIEDFKLGVNALAFALRSRGFRPIHVREVDRLGQLLVSEAKYVAVVLDIMLPPGQRYANRDHDQGTRTGIFVYQDIRALFPSLPILVLTHIADPQILDQIPDSDMATTIEYKNDILPSEVANSIASMVSETNGDMVLA